MDLNKIENCARHGLITRDEVLEIIAVARRQEKELTESRTQASELSDLHAAQIRKIDELTEAIAEMQGRMGALIAEKVLLEQKLEDRATAAYALTDAALGMNADVQAGLVAALKDIIALKGTEDNEWDGVERVIPEMVKIATDAICKVQS